ncbi:MAG: flavin reductase family protein [Candidatus Brocadiia bacterium]|nr:flavin reductase family protein [Planctomycetota bacterium]
MLKEVSVDEAWKCKYPEQVALATCDDPDGAPDIIALGWFMPTSFAPPMCAISVGHTRYSHELITTTGEFVACFPTEGFEADVLYCGSNSGRDVDKFAETQFTASVGQQVSAPLIEECVVNLECVVEGTLETGDHTIFGGRIVAAHLNENAGRRIYNMGNGHTLKPLP